MAYGTVNADVIGTSVANANLGAKNASTLQNRLINAGFTINQRVYVSGTALSAGVYAHDRFKAGASGCTYTFTQGSAGVPIVITITAGSLQQVIEGCNMPEGGTYVLSWTGTAQARFNGGTYGSSPLAVTGITAGANTTIEFNTGTVSFPQLEVGSSATGFEYRQYQQELALCQRYYYQLSAAMWRTLIADNATGAFLTFDFPIQQRTAPTGVQTTGSFVNRIPNTAVQNAATVVFGGATISNGYLVVTSSGMTAGQAMLFQGSGGNTIGFTGVEL